MGKVRQKPKATKPPEFGEVLTLADAAAYLQVGEDGLAADAAAGRLPAGHVAGEWRFSRRALLDWLAQYHPARPIRWPEWPDPDARDQLYEEYESRRQAGPAAGEQAVA